MSIDSVDCVVIGAGVVGLACARALAMAGRDVIVIEATGNIGSGTSSRNSEVLHAGIYYSKHSLKAELCVRGNKLITQYCDDHAIPYKRCGKLIVATDEDQISTLHTLKQKGRDNQVNDLVMLTPAQTLNKEPEIRCVGSLYSPSTGIVDSHTYMLNLQGDLENAGGAIAFNSRIVSGNKHASGCEFNLEYDNTFVTIRAKTAINCAGLGAIEIARNINGIEPGVVPKQYLAKGNYYSLRGRNPFSHLIYPIPGTASLGIHFSLDLQENGRFGPDIQWISDINYDVDSNCEQSFYTEIKKYWPALPNNSLLPAFTGIRPKVQSPNEAAKDFLFQEYSEHGIPGLINCFGIESPGLTASLAIAEHVVELTKH